MSPRGKPPYENVGDARRKFWEFILGMVLPVSIMFNTPSPIATLNETLAVTNVGIEVCSEPLTPRRQPFIREKNRILSKSSFLNRFSAWEWLKRTFQNHGHNFSANGMSLSSLFLFSAQRISQTLVFLWRSLVFPCSPFPPVPLSPLFLLFPFPPVSLVPLLPPVTP